MTVLPVETEFDSKAQAVVHGSVDAVTEQDSMTFEAIEGMAVFDSETQSFWVAPRPKDKSGVVYDELSDTAKKKFDASRFKEIDNLLKLNALSVMSPEESDHFAKTTLRTSYQQTCWTNGSSRMTVQWLPKAGACWSVGKIPRFTSWSVLHPLRRKKESW